MFDRDREPGLDGPVGVDATDESSSGPFVEDVDRELEAAIEYKIATHGLDGIQLILDIVHIAVRRRLADSC